MCHVLQKLVGVTFDLRRVSRIVATIQVLRWNLSRNCMVYVDDIGWCESTKVRPRGTNML